MTAPDLLSILATDKNVAVAAVATKAESYARDVEKLQCMAVDNPGAGQDWANLAVSYGIVARELKTVAQDLKRATS